MRRPFPAAWLLPLVLLAAACSSDESLSDRLAGGRVRGDAHGVVVYRASSVVEALPLAMGHCAHFHRSAQYDRRIGDGYRFRCLTG